MSNERQSEVKPSDAKHSSAAGCYQPKDCKTSKYIGKGLASVAVCGLGAFSMYLTGDHMAPTGIGWAILGILLIWG